MFYSLIKLKRKTHWKGVKNQIFMSCHWCYDGNVSVEMNWLDVMCNKSNRPTYVPKFIFVLFDSKCNTDLTARNRSGCKLLQLNQLFKEEMQN